MNKKKIKIILSIIVFILLIIVFILAYILLNKYILKVNFENDVLPFASKNDKTIFQINKITFFSNCDAKNKTNTANNFTIENLYQYTDLAIFISSSSSEEKTMENTLKKVSIENIKYNKKAELRRT